MFKRKLLDWCREHRPDAVAAIERRIEPIDVSKDTFFNIHATSLVDAFTWEFTSEGYEFWEELHREYSAI